MKNAQQYLDEAEAAKPSPYDYGDFEQSQALAAVQAALDDSARYKNLLIKAIRNSSTPPQAPDLCTCSRTPGN